MSCTKTQNENGYNSGLIIRATVHAGHSGESLRQTPPIMDPRTRRRRTLMSPTRLPKRELHHRSPARSGERDEAGKMGKHQSRKVLVILVVRNTFNAIGPICLRDKFRVPEYLMRVSIGGLSAQAIAVRHRRQA